MPRYNRTYTTRRRKDSFAFGGKELKWFDWSFALGNDLSSQTLHSSAASIVPVHFNQEAAQNSLVSIPSGSGVHQRVGTKAAIKKITLHISIVQPFFQKGVTVPTTGGEAGRPFGNYDANSAAPEQEVTFFLLHDCQYAGSPPAFTEIFQQGTQIQGNPTPVDQSETLWMRRLDRTDRFKILWQKTVRMRRESGGVIQEVTSERVGILYPEKKAPTIKVTVKMGTYGLIEYADNLNEDPNAGGVVYYDPAKVRNDNCSLWA